MRKGAYDPTRNPDYSRAFRFYSESKNGNSVAAIRQAQIRMRQYSQYASIQNDMMPAVLALTAIMGGR